MSPVTHHLECVDLCLDIPLSDLESKENNGNQNKNLVSFPPCLIDYPKENFHTPFLVGLYEVGAISSADGVNQ